MTAKATKITTYGAGPLFTRLARAGRFDDIRLLAEYVKARSNAANDNVAATDLGVDSVMVVRPTVEEIARAGRDGLRFDDAGRLVEWRVADADGAPRLDKDGKEIWLKPVERYKQPRGSRRKTAADRGARAAEHAERIMALRGSGVIPPALVVHHKHPSVGAFFGRLWAAYDAMVLVGVPSRLRDILRSHGVDGGRTLEQCADANPQAAIQRGRTVIVRGAGFMAGRTDSSGTATQGSFVGAPDAAESAMIAAVDAARTPIGGVLDMALAGKTAREIAAEHGWAGKHGERKAVLEVDAAIARLRRAA